jgi:acetoacetyl-CoA synthetase
VFAGELSGACLGVDAVAIDAAGQPVIDERGELVVRRPLPSMPVGIYGDRNRKRLRESYYDAYPGCWRHGDWVRQTRHGSWVVEGRSDATLNRGGIRLGTGEYYDLLSRDAGVEDSLVVFLDGESGEAGKLIIFLKRIDHLPVDEAFEASIRQMIRRELSPRHVPDEIYGVTDVPMTHSGKRMEVPIKRLLSGAITELALPGDAIANPSCIAEYEVIRERRSRRDATTVPATGFAG